MRPMLALLITAAIAAPAQAAPTLAIDTARSDVAWATADLAIQRAPDAHDISVDVHHCKRRDRRRVRCAVAWETEVEHCSGRATRTLGSPAVRFAGVACDLPHA